MVKRYFKMIEKQCAAILLSTVLIFTGLNLLFFVFGASDVITLSGNNIIKNDNVGYDDNKIITGSTTSNFIYIT